MPKVKAGNLALNYQQQGTGEPLILIPFLTADHACYAFQVAEYAKHFTCISTDLRGTGESDNPPGNYSTEQLADDMAAFTRALGIAKAHITGLSLEAITGMWLAAKCPGMVSSLSLHSVWTKTDLHLRTVVKSLQTLARALNNVAEMVIQGLFPWCLTPDLYAEKPEYVEQLSAFVRSRSAQTLESFIRQSDAVLKHDVESQLGRITVPALIAFGRHDVATPPALPLLCAREFATPKCSYREVLARPHLRRGRRVQPENIGFSETAHELGERGSAKASETFLFAPFAAVLSALCD